MKKLILALVFMVVYSADAISAGGCTIYMDNATGKIIKQKGECDKRYSPASTFKIPLALIGYDSGILIDTNTPAWPFQEGYLVNKDDDKQTTNPILWEKNSVVWYSQKITAQLGAEKFKSYVKLLHYGNMDVSGDKGKNNGLSRSWVSSSLQISPLEQIKFLQNVLNRKYKLSEESYLMLEEILPVFETSDGWVVHGKTGSSAVVNKNGVVDANHPNGWFVGWAERNGRKIVFVKLVLGDSPSWKMGLVAREEFLKEGVGLDN